MKTNSFTKKIFLVAALIIFSFFLVSSPVYAQLPITEKDVEYINKTQNYRDAEEPVPLATCGSAQIGNIRSIYMIGDSITEGAETRLRTTLGKSGAEVTINGLSSRNLSDGLEVLESDLGDHESDVVVIALGTNGGLTEPNINSAIDIVKNQNEASAIFWVNTFVDNSLREDSLGFQTWNDTLKKVSSERNFYIIDWSAAADQAIQSAGNNLAILADDGLGVHPTTSGRDIFSNMVAGAIFGETSVGGCSTVLVGADNPEKVWNFMISMGLEPFQAAGFMGNMQAEAGFEPRRTEYAWSDPPHLSDTVPPCANDKCQPGYGLVQWTAKTRKDGLSAFSVQKGKMAGDLGLQLEYVWEEINGACCSLKQSFRDKYGDVTVLEALKKTETTEEATDLILRNYEIPADMDKAYTVRIGFANAWLVKFGSGGE